MNSTRPINLNLFRLRFPVMAIASILHRISGVIIFLFLPFLLYLLHQSLISQERYDSLVSFIHEPGIQLLLIIIFAAVTYHSLAGLRHLLMDMGFGESLSMGRSSAYLIIILAVILTFLFGAWLWLS